MRKQIPEEQIKEKKENPFHFEGLRIKSSKGLLCSLQFPRGYREREEALHLSKEGISKLIEKAEGVVRWNGETYLLGSVVFYGGSVISVKSEEYNDLVRRIDYARKYASICI